MTTRTTNKQIQHETRLWLAERDWDNPLAATLTLKQAARIDSCFMSLTHIEAAGCLKHALRVVDRKLFGNQVRNGKRLQRFPVLEGGEGVRYHYHLLIDVPQHLSREIVAVRLSQAWKRSFWGYDVNQIEPCDQGWANYITKLASKEDYALSIDWENVA
jgi:hypothetical protein